jgi:hypothetical protein
MTSEYMTGFLEENMIQELDPVHEVQEEEREAEQEAERKAEQKAEQKAEHEPEPPKKRGRKAAGEASSWRLSAMDPAAWNLLRASAEFKAEEQRAAAQGRLFDDGVDVCVRDGGDALWEMNHYVRRSRLH